MMIQLSTSTYYCQFTCIPGIILKKIMDAHPKDGLSWKFEISMYWYSYFNFRLVCTKFNQIIFSGLTFPKWDFLDPTPAYQISHFAIENFLTLPPIHARLFDQRKLNIY